MASIGLLTASMAHEINNPVNYISVGVETLQELLEETWQVLDKYTVIENEPAPDLQLLKEELVALKEALDFEEYKMVTFGTLQDIQAGAKRMTEVVKSLQVFS